MRNSFDGIAYIFMVENRETTLNYEVDTKYSVMIGNA